MKTRLIVAAAWLAVAGLGCQRTYEDRSAGYTDERELDSKAGTASAQLEYGEEGQQQDVNLSQDLPTEQTEAFGGSGTAGMGTAGEDFGYGGGGDAGMMKGDAATGGHHMGHHMMDGGMMMHGDAGMMMGTDAGLTKKKATKR